ncbi:MAG: inositol monophosphatase [Acetobacteraceae bacterium]
MTVRPLSILPDVIDAVAEAGRMVAEEFARPGGPRLVDHVTAPIDHEIELFLRARLMALVPARFVGEEAGIVAAEENGLCWVVDPHDGTRAFLEGKRGSAVSVALLRRGQPVLGVVYAPLSPDRGRDMIAWAEGGGITRNGAAVPIDLSRRGLTGDGVVFLNHGVWQRPVWNSLACAPARFMPLPSIAYRLARIAVGDGIATQTLRPVNALDIAAGHALLMAAGGVLLAEDGTPVTYNDMGESRPSACFGGAPQAVAILLGRSWRGSTETRRPPRVTLDWPRIGETPAFDRAAGSLIGLMLGSSLADPDTRSSGQPSAGGELALSLARTLTGQPAYDAQAAAAAYADWLRSGPSEADAACLGIFRAAAETATGMTSPVSRVGDPDHLGSAALPRVVPIGLWAGSAPEAAAAAMQDVALSHPHPLNRIAGGALAGAIAAGIGGADPTDMARIAVELARTSDGGGPVAAALEQALAGVALAADAPPVLRVLQHAFRHLASGAPADTALAAAARAGADACAVTGALLGCAHGRLGFPVRLVMPVLTCRPDAGLAVPAPRPDLYWPDDLIELAEALLLSRAGRTRESA